MAADCTAWIVADLVNVRRAPPLTGIVYIAADSVVTRARHPGAAKGSRRFGVVHTIELRLSGWVADQIAARGTCAVAAYPCCAQDTLLPHHHRYATPKRQPAAVVAAYEQQQQCPPQWRHVGGSRGRQNGCCCCRYGGDGLRHKVRLCTHTRNGEKNDGEFFHWPGRGEFGVCTRRNMRCTNAVTSMLWYRLSLCGCASSKSMMLQRYHAATIMLCNVCAWQSRKGRWIQKDARRTAACRCRARNYAQEQARAWKRTLEACDMLRRDFMMSHQ